MAIDPFNKKKLNYKSYINTVKGLYERPVAQTSTALILTLITIGFFGLVAIRPTFTTVTKLEAELKEKRAIEAEMQSKLSDLNTVQELYLENEELLQVYDKAIPSDQNLENIIAKLEYLSLQNQTPLRSMQISDIVTYGERDIPGKGQDNDKTDPFPSFNISLTVEGNYDQLTRLVNRYSSIDRYVKIDSINFNQPSEEDAGYELSMSVRMRVYWVGNTVSNDTLKES